MLKNSAVYAPRNWHPWHAEIKGVLGISEEKARGVYIRLTEIKPKVWWRYLRRFGSNADLRYANLSNADLYNADLRYANLRNANLSNANLRYAKYNNSTQWPENYCVPNTAILVEGE
jgi:hypothetical protein